MTLPKKKDKQLHWFNSTETVSGSELSLNHTGTPVPKIHTPTSSNHTYPDEFQPYVPQQEHGSADGHTAQRTCFLNSVRGEAKVRACATECGREHPDSPACCAIREGKKRRDKAKKERSCSGGPHMPKPNLASFRNSDSHWLCTEIQQSRRYYITG